MQPGSLNQHIPAFRDRIIAGLRFKLTRTVQCSRLMTPLRVDIL
jgi:hypothetical protein